MKFNKLIIILIIGFLMNICLPVYAFGGKKAPISDESTIMEYINIDWWKELNDPILLNYIIKAIHCNLDLKISTLKVEEAKETKNIKRANEMPTIGVGAVPALYKLPGLTNSDGLISLPIYANYELDLFGKNRNKTKSLDRIYEISMLNEKSAYISVVCAVGSTYYNIVKLDKLIDLQEQIIKDRKKIYDLMKLSNEEGITSTADTISANKAYINANTDMIELKKTRERLLNSLAVLTGESPEISDGYERISFDDLVINKTIPDYISSEVIESRPDYIAAEKMVEKAGLDVRAAKKEFLPTINIIGLISFNSTEYLKKMNWKNSVGLLAGNAMLPLFTGGSRIANLKLQKNKYEQALENYKKTNLISIQEINDALNDLKLDNEKYLKTKENLEAEREDFSYTTLKYKEGIISGLDLLQKREALLVTEKVEAMNKTDYFINQIGLYKSTAGAKI